MALLAAELEGAMVELQVAKDEEGEEGEGTEAGAPAPCELSAGSTLIFAAADGVNEVEMSEVQGLLERGTLTAATLVISEGVANWVSFGQFVQDFGLEDELVYASAGEGASAGRAALARGDGGAGSELPPLVSASSASSGLLKLAAQEEERRQARRTMLRRRSVVEQVGIGRHPWEP